VVGWAGVLGIAKNAKITRKAQKKKRKKLGNFNFHFFDFCIFFF
jgi:hypothetical protein